MSDLAFHFARALHLLALSFLPGSLHPDPRPEHAEGAGAFALVILAALFAIAIYGGKRVATILFGGAVALSLAASVLRPDAPLAQSVVFVAPWAWGALAATLASVAHEKRVLHWERAPQAIAIGVIAVGAIVVGRWAIGSSSPASLWAETLRRDPAHEVALGHVADGLFSAQKYREVVELCDRCIDRAPERCTCLELRARALVSGEAPTSALDLRGLAERCGTRGSTQAILARAHALAGDLAATEQAILKARSLGESEAPLRYALALAYERTGRFPEAEAEAERAVAAGAGRDAILLLAAIRIARGDLKRAGDLLDELLQANPKDVDALYNRALVADREGNYNVAREGYLAVLAVSRDHTDARYNLALLTLRAGVTAEAKHHAQRFAETAPEDPRRKALESAVGISR